MFSYEKIVELKEVAEKYVETDIDISAAMRLARRALQSKDNIDSHVLPEDFLENPPKSPRYDNLYVFIPADDNWNKVHEWVKCVLEGSGCE